MLISVWLNGSPRLQTNGSNSKPASIDPSGGKPFGIFAFLNSRFSRFATKGFYRTWKIGQFRPYFFRDLGPPRPIRLCEMKSDGTTGPELIKKLDAALVQEVKKIPTPEAKEIAAVVPEAKINFFQRLGITADEFSQVADENPSIRGVIVGYVAERKLKEFFAKDKRASNLYKDDDHDRKKKGDLNVTHNGRTFKIESKSLQTNSIKRSGENWSGTFQCDASDCRPITLPNGHRVTTTCLMVGEFDILAINLFGFGGTWRFAFALNNDLPRTTSKKYSDEDKPYLLKSLPSITLPLAWPYVDDPFILMDLLIAGQKSLPKPTSTSLPLFGK